MNGLVISVLAAFAVFAVADWVAVARGAHRVEYVCKPAATVTLIALALALPEVDDPAMRFWFVVALVASLAGDVFLMLDDRWFLAGLGAFLVGHLGYVVGLAGQIDSARGLAAGVVLVLLAVPALGVRIVRGARARDARMALPVAIYMAAISAMVVLAFASGDVRAVAGALLFYGSDAVLGVDRFVLAVRHRDVAVMTTYHLGQVLLVLSLLP